MAIDAGILMCEKLSNCIIRIFLNLIIINKLTYLQIMLMSGFALNTNFIRLGNDCLEWAVFNVYKLFYNSRYFDWIQEYNTLNRRGKINVFRIATQEIRIQG